MTKQKTSNHAREQAQTTQWQTYSPNDLASALVIACKHAKAAEPLRDFYKQRAIAMCFAFGAKMAAKHTDGGWSRFSLYDIPGVSNDDAVLIVKINHFIGLVNSASHPFSGLLEAPKVLFDFLRSHNKHIKEAVNNLHAVYLNLLTDALCRAYHIDPNSTVTDDDLRDNGFDPGQQWPDPDDYL